MPDAITPPTEPAYAAGDILVAASGDGSFEVSRVGANGRSIHVLGFQHNQPAALIMASRATSGRQRVFLRPEPGSAAYRLVG